MKIRQRIYNEILIWVGKIIIISQNRKLSVGAEESRSDL